MFVSSVNNYQNPIPSFPKSKPTPSLDFKKVVSPSGEGKKNWHERAIAYLDKKEFQLEEMLPNSAPQDKIDQLGRAIKAHFAPLKAFNRWLDNNGEGAWYNQLATFLVKLPLRAIRNIVHLLYSIVKGALFALVHPLKGINHLAKLIIRLIHELSKPETWSQIGIGMVGASLGQALVTGNPLSVIGFGLGISFLIGGLSIGAIKAAIHAEKGSKLEAAKENLLSQAKQLPESALTGFFMGLIVGGIQRAIKQNQPMKSFRATNQEEAKLVADSYIKEHNLPKYTKVELDPTGKITIKWTGSDLVTLEQTYPKFFDFEFSYGNKEFPNKVTIELHGEGGRVITHIHGFDDYFLEGYEFNRPSALESIGVHPITSENIQFNKLGSALGGVTAFKNQDQG